MKRRFRFSFLLLAGILLLGAGLIGLTSVPDVMQYAFIPATESTQAASVSTDTNSGTQSGTPKNQPEASKTPLYERLETIRDAMGDFFPKLTLHGVKAGTTLSKSIESRVTGTSQSDIYLYSVGSDWNEIYYPKIRDGRPISRVDAQTGADVIVLDEKTAFALFGEAGAVDGMVELNGKRLEVVGVASHSRRIGETGQFAAWVPLDQVKDCNLMILSAPASSISKFPMFKAQAEKVIGGGTAISLVQEKYRAVLPLLLVFIIAAIWLLKRWIHRLTGYGKIQVEKVRAESKKRYPLQMIPYAAGQLLPVVLLFAATLAVCFGVAALAMRPMVIFPEWVPETLGEYSSWADRFWQLVGTSAAPVSMRTPELTEVQFWSNLILWGTILILLRAAKKTLTGFVLKKEED